jgi:hypothetical protein
VRKCPQHMELMLALAAGLQDLLGQGYIVGLQGNNHVEIECVDIKNHLRILVLHNEGRLKLVSLCSFLRRTPESFATMDLSSLKPWIHLSDPKSFDAIAAADIRDTAAKFLSPK